MLKNKKVIYIGLILIVFSLFMFEINIGKKVLKSNNITYSKESTLNYITYLKNNNHFSDTYLQNNYNLVASLVDYFNIDYNYSYIVGEDIDYKLSYEVLASLEIYDSDNDVKPIDKKEYVLLENNTIEGTGKVIKVDLYNLQINYDLYNNIVQAWKREISPNASLKVYFNVEFEGYSNTLNKVISDKTVREFIIPMAKKTIDIKAPNNINESGVLTGDKKFDSWYLLLLASTLVLFLTGVIYFLTYLTREAKKKSKYDQKINKILREFDRAITEAKGKFVKNKKDTYIEVKDFMELLDVHDNVNEPIIHYQNTKNINVFVIKNGKDIFYCVLNRKDFE